MIDIKARADETRRYWKRLYRAQTLRGRVQHGDGVIWFGRRVAVILAHYPGFQKTRNRPITTRRENIIYKYVKKRPHT